MRYYEFSIFDILPYFYVVIFLIFLTYRKVKNRELLMFWIIFIFSAIRYGIGYDYFNYCNVIEHGGNFEPLSNLFLELSRISECNQLFFILNSFCAIFPIYFVAKHNSADPNLSILIYYLFPILFLESLGIVRNASAYGAVFLSYHFVVRRRLLLAILCIIIAGQFHYSGYIGFLLLLVCFMPLDRKISIVLFLASFVVGEYFLAYIQDLDYEGGSVFMLKLLRYADKTEEQGRFMKYIIILLNIFNLYFWRWLEHGNIGNRKILNLVNLGTCLWIIFSFDKTLSLRLSSYFLMFQILLVPFYYVNLSLKYKKTLRTLIVLFFLAYFTSGFVVNVLSYKIPAKMNYIPYQTIFIHEDYINYKAAN